MSWCPNALETFWGSGVVSSDLGLFQGGTGSFMKVSGSPKVARGRRKGRRPGVALSAASCVARVDRLTSLGLAFSSVKLEVG